MAGGLCVSLNAARIANRVMKGGHDVTAGMGPTNCGMNRRDDVYIVSTR